MWHLMRTRLTRFFASALLAIAAVAALPGAARGAVNVAIIDYQDQFSGTKGLASLLGDVGQSFTDLTAGLVAGNALNLTGYDTFIVGSFCTQQANIRTALANASTGMRSFVNNGGTIIVLTQADQTVANEAWVQAPAVITRADPDFDGVKRVQAGHQVFNTPQAMSDANLQGWQYIGTSTWPTSWESLSVFAQVGVLAGNDTIEVSMATIAETGWGTGRGLVLAMAPDKARNIGNAQAKAQAPRLMQNLLRYAEDVKAGTVPPIQIYQGGGTTGPLSGVVYRDENGNGMQDGGEPGIPGVGVSDTIDLVLTAADGRYTLPNAAGGASLLYVCLPAGYAKSNTWWRRISGQSAPAAFDFGLRPADESPVFDFIQVSDVHIGGSGNKALMIAALDEIARLKDPPAFVIATGDLADVGSNLTHFEDYAAGAASSQVPYFNVFGNHDANSGGSINYRRYLGPDYYSFDYADCHFLIVNSVHNTTSQTAWVAKNMQLLRGGKRLFIFQHYSPSQAEHDQFSAWTAEAVFSGHWHSQHTVRVGNMTSYNTPTFLFGGIDCSPAGFKILHVSEAGTASRVKWLADGNRLHIINPSGSLLVSRGTLSILVNAYQTSAEIASVTYQLKSGEDVVAEGALSAQGDWNWVGTIPPGDIARGAYDLEVTATNDRGEESFATTSFMVLSSPAPKPAPETDWTQFGGGAQRGAAAPAELAPPLRLAWHYYTGGTIDFASPVLKDSAVYMGVKDRGDFQHNGVVALNGLSGQKQWFTPTPAAVSHSVAVDDARVYACSHGGILHALDRLTGGEIWSQTLGSPYQRFQYSGPVLAGDKVFAGTYAYFGSFQAADGLKNWNQTYGADWIACNACPAVSGNTVVVPANWASNIRGVNAATGSTIWTFNVQGLHGSPVISGDNVVFTDYNGVVHCAALSNGALRWEKSLGGGRSASTPAVSAGVVVTGGTGTIRGYALSNGDLLWSTPIGTSPLKMAPYNNGFAALVGSPTIAFNTAYVPCGDGRLYALNLQNGQIQWTLDIGAPLLSAPCISGNMLYLSSYDGNVYALMAGEGTTVAADFDEDFDVDMDDFGFLQACMSEAGVLQIPAGCETANLNGDQVVNQADLGVFLLCFSGPNLQVPDSCP